MTTRDRETPGKVRELAREIFENKDALALLRLLERRGDNGLVYMIKPYSQTPLLDIDDIKKNLLDLQLGSKMRGALIDIDYTMKNLMELGFRSRTRHHANDVAYDETLNFAFNLLGYFRYRGLVDDLWRDHVQETRTDHGAMAINALGRTVLSMCKDMAEEEVTKLARSLSEPEDEKAKLATKLPEPRN